MSLYKFYCTVNNVIDGDTIAVEADLGFNTFRRENLRLAFIDTPELSVAEQEEDAKAARDFVINILSNNDNKCQVKTYDTGARGRYIAEVFVDSHSETLNTLIVKNGHLKDGYIPAPEAIPNEFINVNTADKKRLNWLPGVGDYTASKIIEYRQNNGDFSKKTDLLNVYGIGDATLDGMIDLITL